MRVNFSKLIAYTLSMFLSTSLFLLSPISIASEGQKQSIDKKHQEKTHRQENVEKDKKYSEDEDTVKFNPDLPALPLTSDLMYQILHADILRQYGKKEESYNEMMQVAQQTQDPRLAQRAAEMAVKDRDAEKALDAVRLWTRLAPKSKETEKYLVNFMVLNGRINEVKTFYLKKLATTSKEDERSFLFVQLQKTLAEFSDKEAAFTALEEVVKIYDKEADAHIALAVATLQKGDSLRAADEAKRALTLKPDSQIAILMLAQMQGDTEHALSLIDNFLKTYPDAQEVQIAYARLLISVKRYESAQKVFEQVLKKSPQEKIALYSLGLLAMQQRKTALAEKYLIEWLNAVEIDKTKAKFPDEETIQIWFLLAQTAEDQRHYDQSLAWLNKIPSDAEDEITIVRDMRRAQIYAKKDDLGRSQRMLSELRKRYPAEAEKILLAQAQILREVKQYRKAYALLKAELSNFSKNTNVLYDFALTAEFIGQYAKMEKVLKQVIALDSHYQHAWNALGYSLADRNIRLEEAQTYIEKALELAPDDPFITDSLGWVYFRQGKLDDAEKKLRKAYTLRADDEIAVHLAEILWVNHKKKEALSLFHKVHQKNASNELLKKTLRRLKIRL